MCPKIVLTSSIWLKILSENFSSITFTIFGLSSKSAKSIGVLLSRLKNDESFANENIIELIELLKTYKPWRSSATTEAL